MENVCDKGHFDEREELISRHFILFSFFALFCHPPLSLPKLLRTPTTSYLVCSLLLYKISAFEATHVSHPPSALSSSFTLCFPFPSFLARPLFSRLPGSCCSLYSLTSCLASCLLLHSHTRFHFQAGATKQVSE